MSESILKKIFYEVYDDEFAEFENAIEHEFSCTHERNMKKIFKIYEKNTMKYHKKPIHENSHKKSFVWSKKRILLAAVMIFLAVLVGCAAAIYTLGGFKTDIQSDNTQLFPIDVEGCPQTIQCVYELTELPDGFELLEHSKSAVNVYTAYKNIATEQTIVLRQCVKSEFGAHYNTEPFELEEIMINEHVGVGLEGKDDYSLAWDNGDYILEVSANLTKKITLDLAKSTKVLEK